MRFFFKECVMAKNGSVTNFGQIVALMYISIITDENGNISSYMMELERAHFLGGWGRASSGLEFLAGVRIVL